jgi:hypothetical protein
MSQYSVKLGIRVLSAAAEAGGKVGKGWWERGEGLEKDGVRERVRNREGCSSRKKRKKKRKIKFRNKGRPTTTKCWPTTHVQTCTCTRICACLHDFSRMHMYIHR